MNEIKCKFCNKQCKNNLSRVAHERFCKENPHYNINIKNFKSAIKKAREKASETIKKLSSLNPLNQINEYKLICKKCGKEYVLCLRNRDFKKGNYGQYCSSSCSNSRERSKETKEKIKNSLRKSIEEKREKQKIEYLKNPKRCVICNKAIQFEKKNNKTCSKKCCLKLISNGGRIGGKISAGINLKRSKNKIEFANLCIENFKNCQVTTNERLFNGWDADIILKDFKIAILWNGIWHYKKVRKNHSLKQVQSRDKLKIIEIKKAGFVPYIIKDIGQYDLKK